MPINAVIFDLDGTVTEPYLDFDIVRDQIGLDKDAGPVLEAIEGMSPGQRRRALEILHGHERRAVEESVLNDGAREAFELLRGRGIAIGILTRNTRANAEAVLGKHRLYCDAIVAREDGPVKPDAFGVLTLCEQFRVKPVETLMVGDYLFDLLSAKAAGASAVLLKNTAKAEDYVSQADYVINKLDELPGIIDNG